MLVSAKEEKPVQYHGGPLMPLTSADTREGTALRVISPSQSSQPALGIGLPALSLFKLVPRARLGPWGQQNKTGFAFILPGVKLKQSQLWHRTP